MNRRELIRAIVPVGLLPTLVVNGQTQAGIANLPKGRYMLFINMEAIDYRALIETPCPEGVEMEVVPVWPRDGQSIQDTVALYNLDD